MQIHTNKTLSKVTFITSIGDYVSLFACLSLLFKQTGNIAIAAYGVPLKSLGFALGSIIYPHLVSLVSRRAILIWSQFISALCLGVLFAACFTKFDPSVIFVSLTIQTALKQIFEIARESISKDLGQNHEQRSLQAQILHGLYGAQFIGPILSFILLETTPTYIPFVIDMISFIWAGLACLSIIDTGTAKVSSNILRPLSYINAKEFINLRQVFLLRSLGYWIPVGLFNYLLFSVVYKRFSLEVQHNAFIYSATGLGSLLAITLIRSPMGSSQNVGPISRLRSLISKSGDANVASMALLALATTRIFFLKLPNFWLILLATSAAGICNGLNAITTQSLRRKVTTKEQFGEIVALEAIVGKVTDWLISTLALYLFTSNIISYETGVWTAAVMLVILAMLHRTTNLMKL